MGELFDLSIGFYANHLHSHLFNFQRSAAVPEPSSSSSSSTSWHRADAVLHIDSKGSVSAAGFISNAAASGGGGEEQSADYVAWKGKVEVVDTGGSEGRKGRGDEGDSGDVDVDAEPGSWSEFRCSRLRRRQYAELSRVRHGVTRFQGFDEGRNALSEGEQGEELEDALRRCFESFDRLGGMRALWDVESGFSGVADGMLQYVKEEYPKLSVLGIPIAEEAPRSLLAHYNMANVATESARRVSVLVPLFGQRAGVFACQMEPAPLNRFESSALLAVAADSLLCTTPATADFNSMLLHLQYGGRHPLHWARAALPLPKDLSLRQLVAQRPFETFGITQSLNYEWSDQERPAVESHVMALRVPQEYCNVLPSRMSNGKERSNGQRSEWLDKARNATELLHLYAQRAGSRIPRVQISNDTFQAPAAEWWPSVAPKVLGGVLVHVGQDATLAKPMQEMQKEIGKGKSALSLTIPKDNVDEVLNQLALVEEEFLG